MHTCIYIYTYIYIMRAYSGCSQVALARQGINRYSHRISEHCSVCTYHHTKDVPRNLLWTPLFSFSVHGRRGRRCRRRCRRHLKRQTRWRTWLNDQPAFSELEPLYSCDSMNVIWCPCSLICWLKPVCPLSLRPLAHLPFFEALPGWPSGKACCELSLCETWSWHVLTAQIGRSAKFRSGWAGCGLAFMELDGQPEWSLSAVCSCWIQSP